MKASTKRFSTILLAILIFVAALFVYNYFVKPAYSEIDELRTEVASRLDFIEKNEASVQQIQGLLKEYQEISDIQETTSLILPLEQDVSQGVNQINGLAGINGLTTESILAQQMAIKPSKQPNLIKGVGVLRFSFRLSGSYSNFKPFLQMMESNIYLMDLVDLKIEQKAVAGVFAYTFTVDSYYQAD